MIGLSFTLETAKSTLLNTQVQIQTSTHNIQNASNTSYARQKAVTVTNPATLIHGGWVGMGARLDQIIQIRDQYIEKQLMQSMSSQSYYQTISDHVDTVQSVFSDNGNNGISDALGAFWDSWDTLQQDTTSSSSQTEVYDSTQSLANKIKNTYNDLNELATDGIPAEVSDNVTEIDSLLSQIAKYNLAISRNESQGVTANDLRDSRYQAVQDLSKLIPLSCTEETDGTLTVSMKDGTSTITLVDADKAGSLQYNSTTNLVSYTQADGSSVAPAGNSISGGSLGGLLASIDDIETYLGELDDFAATLIKEVNALHSQSSGTNVFSGTNAGDISMVANFLSTMTAPEESSRALAISNLQDSKVTFPDGSSSRFSGFLSNIQEKIGNDGDDASTQQSYYKTLSTSLQQKQQSVSGISLDEEMVELLKDQQIYQAAAKIISNVKDMLDTVIGMA